MSITVIKDRTMPNGYYLMDGHTAMSHVNAGNPGDLKFSYMQRMADAITCMGESSWDMNVLHLGGGAMTMARWIAAKHPSAFNVVVEKNPEVVKAVANTLDRVPSTAILIEDAVDALKRDYRMEFDVIIVDCMDSTFRTPQALVSAEAFSDMADLLKGYGILLINMVVDTDLSEHILADVRVKLLERFGNALELRDPMITGGLRNIVLAAWFADSLDVERLTRRAKALEWEIR